MAIDNLDNSWSDYVSILRRRWRLTVAAVMIVSLGTIYVAYTLPPIYESSAAILIEQQGIPTDFVQTTVNAYAEQLLQTIYQRVVAGPKVAELIEKFDLYPEERGLVPEEDLLLRFRDSTKMTSQNVTSVHARTGREATITFGFQISFEYSDAVKAKNVAEEMANLFVSYNADLRSETAARTSKFLDVEANQLEMQLGEVSQRIAQFKENNPNNLPEDQGVNLRTWERLKEELTQLDIQRRATQETKALLEAEIIDIPRYRPVLDESGEPILGGIDQLAAAQQELIRLRGKYSESHPSIINLRKEIASLSSSPASRASLAEQLRTDLRNRRQELAGAREVYSDNHPQIVTLQGEVRSLERQLYDIETEISASGAGTAQPNNPAYVQTRTRIGAAEEELTDLRRRNYESQLRVDELETMRIRAPQVEREFAKLTQEQDVLLAQYQDLRTLEADAAMGEALETGQSGERLTIVEPARVPSNPVSPDRLSMSFLGIVLSIAVGLGVMSIAEAMDQTGRGRNDLYQLLEVPPMGIIPYVETTLDTVKRRSLNVVMSAAVLGAILFIVSTVQS